MFHSSFMFIELMPSRQFLSFQETDNIGLEQNYDIDERQIVNNTEYERAHVLTLECPDAYWEAVMFTYTLQC